MINPQTGAITRTAGQSTQYPWMSPDQQDDFDDFDTLHPLARNTPVVVGGNIILDDAAYASNRANIQPTMDAYFATPGTAWDDYLFQMARRENVRLAPETAMGPMFDTSRWVKTQTGELTHDPYFMSRNFLPNTIWPEYVAGEFQDTDELVQYMYNSPERHELYTTGESVYDYEMQEYEHYNDEFQNRLDNLISRMPRTDTFAGEDIRSLYNELTNEWIERIQTGTNTRNPDLYRLLLQTNLEHMDALDEALDNGASSEQITNMIRGEWDDIQLTTLQDFMQTNNRSEADVNQLVETVQGQQAYININGHWHLGEVSNAMVLDTMGYSKFPTATVEIEYLSGGRHGGTETYTVPIQNTSFRLADDWQPDHVARWQPYTDPSQEYPTSARRVTDHIGEQILYDGQWRTLASVRAFDPRGNPMTGVVNTDTTLIWEDGTQTLLTNNTPLTYRIWGEEEDPVERVPQNVVQRTGTQRSTPTTPVETHQRAETTFDQLEPTEPTGQQVMSYLHREHNEVYTTWRAPNYTGTDPNRVERIFGGVVPFMSYNSEGHPILVNDQELDHHGHTEFNMVHIAPMEMAELAQGQVNVENEATVNQTNNEPTSEGNSPAVPP